MADFGFCGTTITAIGRVHELNYTAGRGDRRARKFGAAEFSLTMLMHSQRGHSDDLDPRQHV
ncbi:hypothetical protein Fuma_03894 [Fuerstiella marisgermanici]|uniref:Uncharacterized protein n=1 Tax=Fuerstiella marisgermanici TaxID=1891926 RepID=A0A1P8WJN5_9PLAN|nr:hypothetical protein Fuma_03894 [Fuerstiella marisgermanici]